MQTVKDLEKNDTAYTWLEIIQKKRKIILVGNMYRNLDCKVNFWDRYAKTD